MGSPTPLFETDEARTYFTTTLFIHPELLENLIEIDKAGDKAGDKVQEQNVKKRDSIYP